MHTSDENSIFINRELSWLAFNKRVLELARESSVPLGEQLKFASIFASNMDEFFMVRVGSLYARLLLKNDETENKTGMTAQQQLHAIMPLAAQLQHQCDEITENLTARIEKYGLQKVNLENLDKEEERFWKKYFLSELFPVLSPQIIDRRHPFPFLRNQEMYVGAMLKEKSEEHLSFGLIPVSTQFERVITVNDGDTVKYALVEEIVLHFAELVFGKKALHSCCLFRVTRNADITMDEAMFDHDIDYRDVMSELLKKRRKLAAVRLQIYHDASAEIVAFLCKKLLLPPEQVFYQSSPLDLSVGFRLASRLQKNGKAQLFYPPVKPLVPPEGYNLAAQAEKGDVLIAYPYQSMRPFIQLLRNAAQDPEVVSIKMTLYRVATDSKIIEALISAAENGKEVVTFVELRARFDEQNNIDWSKQLENAGCTVIYGFADYKIHSKLTLITKKRGGKFSYISQIGTGNYNEKTSELYTDLSFVSANTQLGEEVASVFNNMALERLTPKADKLLVAPLCFKNVLLEEMDHEIAAKQAGHSAQVLLKCNSISDKEMIDKIADVSTAGVPVYMIIRGICCLKAGVAGKTENVHVRSLVGRYLEHSRIYAFGMPENLRVYICSGDFLTRNTQRRVEIGVRVQDKALANKLYQILLMQLEDTENAQIMLPNGEYTKVKKAAQNAVIDSQMGMYSFLSDAWKTAPVPMPEEKEKKGFFARLFSK